MNRITTEVYFSVDVEADGKVSVPSSLVSLGACAAAVRHQDGSVERLDPDEETFYREVQPISEHWDPAALAVSGLTREHLERNGVAPSEAMRDFVAWIEQVAANRSAKPVFAAYPLAFDWQFVYHYLVVYADRSPFGHSAHYDMKTAYAVLARTAVRDAVKRRMPKSLLGSRPHTHNALEDAKGQADLLVGLLRWQAEQTTS
jgi:3' exoribonuclease, RNase T-like